MGRPRIPELIRFWSKVDKSPSQGPNGDCWIWIGGRFPSGYGHYNMGEWPDMKNMRSHRAAWVLTNGPIPDGLCLLHKCDNRPCVNPDHMFIGTNADNTADMVAKGRAPTGDRSGPRKFIHRMRRGERHGMAKLTNAKVLEMRSTPGTFKSLAAQFGVSSVTVAHIINRRTWKHI